MMMEESTIPCDVRRISKWECMVNLEESVDIDQFGENLINLSFQTLPNYPNSDLIPLIEIGKTTKTGSIALYSA